MAELPHEWTREEWDKHIADGVRLYVDAFKETPLKSPDCCGCPSWPFSMCFPCAEYNRLGRD